MATERLGRAVLEIVTEKRGFFEDVAAIKNEARTGLPNAFKATRSSLDDVAVGMSSAGREAGASSKLIAGMSDSGRQAAEGLGKVNPVTAAMKTGFDAVRGSLASMVAGFTIAGGVTAIVQGLAGAIAQTAADGAKLSGVSQSFDQLTKSIGQSGDAMLAATRSGSKGLIRDLDLIQASNKAMLLGLPVTAAEMGKLAQTATVLGRAMGQDATKSMDDLITALGRSSPMILDNLGLTVKLGEANERYAASLGKPVGELTEAEKKTAFYNAAMEAASQKVEALGEKHLTVSEQVSRLATALANVAIKAAASANENSTLSTWLGKVADAAERAAQNADDYQKALKRVEDQQGRFKFSDLEAQMAQLEAARLAGTVEGPKLPGLPVLGAPNLGLTAGTLSRDIERLEAQSAKLQKTIDKGLNPALLTTNEQMRDWTFYIGKIGTSLPAAIDKSNESVVAYLPNMSQLDALMTELPGKVTNFNEGVDYGAQAQAAAAARTLEWHENILGLADAFFAFGSVAGGSVGLVIDRIGAAIEAVSVARDSVGSLTSGFRALGAGSILKGLTGIVGGIGGIVSAAQAAVSVIRGLWHGLQSLFGGGEEGTVVNPWRDKFFGQFVNRYHLSPYESLVAAFDDAIAGGLQMNGDQVSALINALYKSDTMAKAQPAAQAILDALAQGGQTGYALPALAEGGIAMAPAWRLFGERGPEAVIPLNRLNEVMGFRERDSAVESKLDAVVGAIGALRREFRLMPSQLMSASLERV